MNLSNIDHRLKELVFSKEELIAGFAREVYKVNQYYKDTTVDDPVVALGLLKGSINFFGNILPSLNFPLVCEFIQTSITTGTKINDKLKIIYDMEISVKNKKVLIIEDIIDSGITATTLIKLLKKRGAKSVEVFTMLDKVMQRKVPFKPRWKIIETTNADWLVGWGLDVNEWGRRFDFVASIKDEYKK